MTRATTIFGGKRKVKFGSGLSYSKSSSFIDLSELVEMLKIRELSDKMLPQVKASTVIKVANIPEEKALRKILHSTTEASTILGATWNPLVRYGAVSISLDDITGNILSSGLLLRTEFLPNEILDQASQHPHVVIREALTVRKDLSSFTQLRLSKPTELLSIRSGMAQNVSVVDPAALLELFKTEQLQSLLVLRPRPLPRNIQQLLAEEGSLEARRLLVQQLTFDEDLRILAGLSL